MLECVLVTVTLVRVEVVELIFFEFLKVVMPGSVLVTVTLVYVEVVTVLFFFDVQSTPPIKAPNMCVDWTWAVTNAAREMATMKNAAMTGDSAFL